MEAPRTPTNLPPDEDLTEVRRPASLLIAQFFLFPLIIIGICIGIFLVFGYLTYDQRSTAEYLNDIRGGSGNQRWQAAFELSNYVKQNPDRVRSTQFVDSVMAAYEGSPDEDIPVRRYLSLILGQLKERRAVPLLVEGLAREQKLKSADWSEIYRIPFLRPSLDQIANDLVDSQIYTLYALGSIGDNAAVPGVLEQVSNQDPSVRKIAVYVSGVLGDPRAVEALLPRLNDTNEDVRVNTALALAQLGNDEGADLLMKFLDRSYVDALQDFTSEQKAELMANAIKALTKLKYEPAVEEIRALSRTDPVPAVRGAALEAVKKF
jgi:HEAT repeat protein